jgi:hypothetical protein
VASDGSDVSNEGTDWMTDEVAVLVGSYFRILPRSGPAATTISQSTGAA